MGKQKKRLVACLSRVLERMLMPGVAAIALWLSAHHQTLIAFAALFQSVVDLPAFAIAGLRLHLLHHGHDHYHWVHAIWDVHDLRWWEISMCTCKIFVLCPPDLSVIILTSLHRVVSLIFFTHC
jgi:hypothetical protein